MPTAKVNGVEIYFERHGDAGEPLVLVHGYTGDITDWRHQLPEFSRTHRVLIMDHRGHGKTAALPDRGAYSIDAMSRDVEALVADASFERYHLLGHSMGGAIAQEIALRSPGRLMSLTLEDTSDNFGATRDERVRAYFEARISLADTAGMTAVADLPGLTATPPHMPPERSAETKLRLERMAAEAFIGAWRGLSEWGGSGERLREIRIPTLVVYGGLEPAGMIAASQRLAEKIPGAELVVIPEAGHSPQYERPDLFNAALRRHLDRNSGAAAK